MIPQLLASGVDSGKSLPFPATYTRSFVRILLFNHPTMHASDLTLLDPFAAYASRCFPCQRSAPCHNKNKQTSNDTVVYRHHRSTYTRNKHKATIKSAAATRQSRSKNTYNTAHDVQRQQSNSRAINGCDSISEDLEGWISDSEGRASVA